MPVEHPDGEVPAGDGRTGGSGRRSAGAVELSQRHLRAPVALAALLVAGHYLFVAVYFGAGWRSESLRRVADLNNESTLGTWLSALLLAAGAVVALLLARAAPQGRRAGWGTVAAALGLACVDEVAAYHELVGMLLAAAFDLDGALRYAWVLPAAVVVSLLALRLVPFVRRLPPQVGRPLLAAGAIYVAGAMGLELLEGAVDSRSVDSAATAMLTGLEEAMEMTGALLALWALLGHAGRVSLETGLDAGADARHEVRGEVRYIGTWPRRTQRQTT